jgi:hypothetical protein
MDKEANNRRNEKHSKSSNTIQFEKMFLSFQSEQDSIDNEANNAMLKLKNKS